jgi:cytochrome bd-type quinol oxidase subunit 2
MTSRTDLGTSPTAVGKQPDTWFSSFKHQGFYARQVAIATILGGLYMHLTRLFLGDDLVLRYVFTPLYDMVLTVPMLYAGVVGLLTWNRIQFRGTMHKIAYGLAWFYIAGSVPMHIWYAYLNNTTEYLRAFPMWWTIVLFPVYTGIIVLMWRLRYKQNAV